MSYSPSPPTALLPLDPTARLEPLAVPIGRFSGILRRHLWVVLTTFCVGVGGMAFVVQQMPKKFTAEAMLVIEPQRTQVSDLQAISPDPGDVGSLLRTQIDILRSPALANGVVQALSLQNSAEFAPGDGGLRAVVTATLGRLGLVHQEAATPLSPNQRIELAAAILSGKIGFANEARSSVLTVQVTTRDPVLSARIANEVARQYLNFKRQEKFSAMQRAHDWFQQQLASLSEQLHAADLRVEKYREQHGLQEEGPREVTGIPTQTVNRQQLDEVSRQLVEVARERARKEADMAQAQMVLRGELPAENLPDVLGSPVVGQLLAQTATVAGREAELAATQDRGNPELAAVRAQLRRLQARTQQEMAHVVLSLSSQVKAARGQEAELQQQLETLRTAVSAENSAEVGLQALLTKARATRLIYEGFLTRATQLANVAGIQEPDAALVSSAVPPLGPSSPQQRRLLAVAGALSAVLGIAIACAIERLRSSFGSPEQIEAALGLPVLAVIPEIRGRAVRRAPGGRAAAPLTSALDKLRVQLRLADERRPKVVMITSAVPQEGKSLIAGALARNAAVAGWRVLLLECDFRRPSLAAQFGLPPAPALREMLVGRMLGEGHSVLHEPQPGLHVIPAGSLGGDPQDLFASNRMAQLVAVFRLRYDLVILDAPPVLPVADSLVLARLPDALLLVVRWEKTARAAVQDALRLLRAQGAPVVGAMISRMNLRKAALAGGRMSYLYKYSTEYPLVRASRG